MPTASPLHFLRSLAAALLLAGCLLGPAQAGPPPVTDATGHMLQLPAPAQRVVSLAPHVTELLYAIGAGERIVGAVSHSDWPPAARDLPRVGRHDSLDMERIAALRPDLVVGWASGNAAHQVARLRRLGIPVYLTEPRALDDISATLRTLGVLVGGVDGMAAAEAFDARLAGLRARYAGASPVRVFYQLWDRPLMTVGGDQIITQALKLCGAENVFADQAALAPQVSLEAVLAANPQVIVSAGEGDVAPRWLAEWRRWPFLHAVRADNLFQVSPDLMHRPTPRLLDGIAELCEQLAAARR
ncbi:cobalamin-binding protein [Ectothiorhodospiraceae bacterium 2226]|nr:cobalamin-binding protein [Ectothiorhodospiraceae bacterium 2226]